MTADAGSARAAHLSAGLGRGPGNFQVSWQISCKKFAPPLRGARGLQGQGMR